MDAFLLSFHDLCNTLMPILGAAVLVCLIILLIKLIKMIEDADAALLKSHETIDLVDRSIEKVQVPLDTAVKVSESVDKAHDATIEAVGTAKDFVVKNATEIKGKVSDIISTLNENDKFIDEHKQPSPEDLIGG